MTGTASTGAARFPKRSAAILAGGKSSRMGTNKGLLEVGGQSILQRTAELLRPLVAEVVLVANDPAPYLHVGLPTVPDVYPGRGAVGGIHAALCHAKHPLVLVVACDMPHLRLPLLKLLLRTARLDDDAVIPRIGGLPEPLLAVYGRGARDSMARAIRAGRLKVMDALEGLRVRFIDEPRLRAADAGLRSFVNVNTPGDLAAARAAAGGARV